MKTNQTNNILDPNKFLSADVMRVNLMLSSMYLSAFEILKATIIEGVKKVIVWQSEPDEEVIRAVKNEMPDADFQSFYNMNVLEYKKLIEEYESSLGIPFDKRERFGLIPSCKWLKSVGILNEEEIEIIKEIRNHRNEIAHELPALLITKGFDVDLNYLEKNIRILKKVEPFFARIDADIPPEIPDDDIMSGGQLILGIVWNTVLDFLEKYSMDK